MSLAVVHLVLFPLFLFVHAVSSNDDDDDYHKQNLNTQETRNESENVQTRTHDVIGCTLSVDLGIVFPVSDRSIQ